MGFVHAANENGLLPEEPFPSLDMDTLHSIVHSRFDQRVQSFVIDNLPHSIPLHARATDHCFAMYPGHRSLGGQHKWWSQDFALPTTSSTLF